METRQPRKKSNKKTGFSKSLDLILEDGKTEGHVLQENGFPLDYEVRNGCIEYNAVGLDEHGIPQVSCHVTVDLKAKIIAKSKYFKMKAICEEAGVSYDTYRNLAKGLSISDEKLNRILNAMKKVAE